MVDRLTLTVNTRLARWLLFNHSRQQAQANLAIWEKPAIYSISDWLRQAWLQSWPDQYVLSELQSQHLWQKIIRDDPATSDLDLLHIHGAASHALKAYQLICEYRLPEDPGKYNNYTEETRTFRRWMTQYQKQLREWKALDPAELMDAVAARMDKGHISFPGTVYFHGFDEITPQMQNWLDLLKNRNVSIHFEPVKPTPVSSDELNHILSQKKATVQKYEDSNDEAIQCARWIRTIYEEGKTIGIVVPEMETYREIIEREFKAELAPASVYPWEDNHIPFNISMGTPLSHEPMVHLALLLLSQKGMRIPLLTFSTLIASPFVKLPEEEKPFRRNLDWGLRGGNTTHVYLPAILDTLSRKQCPALEALLEELLDWIKDSSFRLPSEWAQEISTFLRAVDWPTSNETLSSFQYQVLSSWNECLDKLSSLDRVLQTIDRAHAISHLTHIARETLFQPQTHEEPIQVIGLLESAGMKFDHLWIMGCHSETLPSFPSPNPFLPFLSLQKPFNLPHSTAERELKFAEQTLFRLAHACDQLVFSHPAWQGENEVIPSPLLAQWVLDENTIQISKSNKIQDHPDFAIQLEKIRDYFPIPVLTEEKSKIKGGSGLLKNQAECPFRAFAIHRLSSESKNFPELDMDESFKGSLIHKIMELLWKNIETSEHLHQLYDSNKLLNQIQQSVREGMQLFDLDSSDQSIFFDIERERLVHLVNEWMEYERERDPFKVIATEDEKTVHLTGLPLELRVDRIDRTTDGKTILIDYKTGIVSNLKKWFGERIEEPQLPLYFLDTDADAIALANIRRGKSRYRGLSREDNLIPRVSSNINRENPELETWDDLKRFWKNELNQLAVEFLDGFLEVAPLQGIDTCKYCDQLTFCRKTELLSSQNGDDE